MIVKAIELDTCSVGVKLRARQTKRDSRDAYSSSSFHLSLENAGLGAEASHRGSREAFGIQANFGRKLHFKSGHKLQ